MSLEHETLRKQPLSKLGVDLACAVIDHHRGEDAVRVIQVLINLAAVMSGKLPSPVDQTICAKTMHDAAVDMLPQPRKRLARPQIEACSSNVIKFASW